MVSQQEKRSWKATATGQPSAANTLSINTLGVYACFLLQQAYTPMLLTINNISADGYGVYTKKESDDCRTLGGDSRSRIDDPLLAKQVL